MVEVGVEECLEEGEEDGTLVLVHEGGLAMDTEAVEAEGEDNSEVKEWKTKIIL